MPARRSIGGQSPMTDTLGAMMDVLRPEVAQLSAYPVPDSRGYIKLDAMENPYPWPPLAVEQWLEKLRDVQPNRYPDPACLGLKAGLKRANQVPEDAELLLGNGSDEIIQILLMALKPGSVVLAPEPTFVMYRQLSRSLALPFVGVPLREDDFSLDVDSILEAIHKHRPAIVFLAYPNNPTGNLFEASAVERILAVAPGLVVIDEAYAPYADATVMRQVGQHANLLVMRTLSKLGLAGLRLGFMAGPPPWIREFDKLRLPYNINVLTQVSAQFALEHEAIFTEQVRAILRDRALLQGALAALPSVRVYESKANFILLRLLRHDANDIFAKLKSAGILIKNLHSNGGLLSQCLRVTVGTPDENQQFIEVFTRVLNAE